MKITKESVLAVLKDPKSKWQSVTLTLVAALAYTYRALPYFKTPQLFAEDGILWLSEGVSKGIDVIVLKPYAGFFHFPERVFGFVVAQFPLEWAPAMFAYTALGLFVIMVYYLLSKRTKILTNNYERLFLVACLCLMANFGEFYFNLSNSVFLMGIIGALIIVADKPKNRLVGMLEKIFFVLTGLCLPFSWFYIPMVLFDRIKYKARNAFYLWAAILTGGAQAVGYLTADTNRSPVTLIAVFSKYSLLVIHNQIITPAVRFARIDMPVAEFVSENYMQYTVYITFIALMLLTWLVIRKSNKQVWMLLFFLVGMTFASIKSPSLTVPTAVDALKNMAVLVGANRYFIFGILGVSLVVVKSSHEIIMSKYRYYFMTFFLAFGLLTSIRYSSFHIEKGWQDYSSQYQQGVKDFNSGKKQVIIPVNPYPWSMGLFRR